MGSAVGLDPIRFVARREHTLFFLNRDLYLFTRSIGSGQTESGGSVRRFILRGEP
jgi:hypothetical protein